MIHNWIVDVKSAGFLSSWMRLLKNKGYQWQDEAHFFLKRKAGNQVTQVLLLQGVSRRALFPHRSSRRQRGVPVQVAAMLFSSLC